MPQRWRELCATRAQKDQADACLRLSRVLEMGGSQVSLPHRWVNHDTSLVLHSPNSAQRAFGIVSSSAFGVWWLDCSHNQLPILRLPRIQSKHSARSRDSPLAPWTWTMCPVNR